MCRKCKEMVTIVQINGNKVEKWEQWTTKGTILDKREQLQKNVKNCRKTGTIVGKCEKL